ncbi:hypothetical protein PC119_g1789 [Phytophthora cactorum]|nr:hypothetical protein PC114_g17096 [Phytophthora cactorum]KAG3039918.1 hypothetical protein PC119_g1789 [Phytophthora cactorum]KAG4052995.1 hypothetical protein PC123_g11829 [Phytophthora cactorum]
MKLWRRVFRVQFPLELRVRTVSLGQSVSPSETSPGTRLCVYLLSCVISAFNLNVVTLRVPAVIAALVQTLRLHSVLGFVHPHHFRNVHHQHVSRFPCVLPTIRSTILRVGPAARKNTSVQGTDSAQAGPAAGTNAVLNKPFSTQAMNFVQRRQAVTRFVQDAIAASVDRQDLNADNVGRGNTKNSRRVH